MQYTPELEIPASVREIASKSVDQAKDAYDRFVDAARQAQDMFAKSTEVFTFGGMVAHVLTFAAHRRTLVALAFAKHGFDELGWGDPMVWVAEPA